MLQNEKLLRTVHARSTDDVELMVSEAFTEIGGGAVLLVSEDTLRNFIWHYDGLLNPAGTLEKAKAGRIFFGRPMCIEPKAVGSVFIITDTISCVLVRYDPA